MFGQVKRSTCLRKTFAEQIPAHLHAIQVASALLPKIRRAYLADIKRYASGHDQERKALKTVLNRLDDKEVNLWRAFTDHGMRPQVYEKLTREYQDERIRIEQALRVIEQDQSEFIDNLDAALAVIAEVAEGYPLHTRERQRDIREQMVSRVVINLAGRIVRIELKMPFDYIDGLHHSRTNGPRDERPGPQKERTSTQSI